jgi:GDPmannose 4,6-dehydratase
MIRNGGRETTARIEHLLDDIYLDEADLREQSRISRIVRAIQPDEIYNLAAQTFIPASWEEPIDTTEATALGVVRMLEAIRNECPTARFFQAGSSVHAILTLPQKSTVTGSPSTIEIDTIFMPAPAFCSITNRLAAVLIL